MIMASKSRIAQEKLQQLEKGAAPFEEQLSEAARFIGTTLDGLLRFPEDGFEEEKSSANVLYHGREAWLLRWLLKRLQAPKDDVPRRTPSSWWLLCYLLRIIPLVNAAQIFVERDFIMILRVALEEADKRDVNAGEVHSESSSTEQGSPGKKSKKRKRSEEPVKSTHTSQEELSSLVEAVFAAVNSVVESAKVTTGTIEQGRSSAFVAEYMRTVIRTSAEEAAKILGSWLSLCQKIISNDVVSNSSAQNWLSPFIEIWQCHKPNEVPYIHFSLYSTRSLLSLFGTLLSAEYPTLDWKSQLEVLIARNIIVPAKAAYSEYGKSEMLESLTKVSVLQDSANAAILFEIAIRCIQNSGVRKRRRPQDDAWLGTVFSTLRAAIPSRASNAAVISAMLESAIDFKVGIDLAVLREIVWEYGLAEDRLDWELVATVLKLDGNTFLIPDEKDLLKQLLERITKASVQETWEEISELVVSEVVVPLMNEFARARDLSGFIKHWYAQLVAHYKIQEVISSRPFGKISSIFSAWEDEALQTELKKLFEPSLTVQQITQILDWLESEIKSYLEHDLEHRETEDEDESRPQAVCIILEAIAGSVSGDESVVDAVGLRLYHIMFETKAGESLLMRYSWRSWRIISRTLTWIECWDMEKLAMLWENRAMPFNQLDKRDFSDSLHIAYTDPERCHTTLEKLSVICTAWEAAKAENCSRLKALVEPLLVSFIESLAANFKLNIRQTEGFDESFYGIGGTFRPSRHTMGVNVGWAFWSFIRCLFVKHSTVLELGLTDGELFQDMLQHIFWISSAGYRLNQESHPTPLSYPDLWMSFLRSSSASNSAKLTKMTIDTMLNSTTNSDNPLIKTDTSNAFATHCLHMLRLEDISKSQKEQIMKNWPSPASTVLDLPVLALKVKIMRHPAIYEGMRFKDLIEFAETLVEGNAPRPQDHLALLKELTRLIFVAAHTNLDQVRNKTYVVEAFKAIQKKVSKASKKKPLEFALIGIIEVALVAFHEKEMALNDQVIIPRSDLKSNTKTFTEALVSQLKPLLVADLIGPSQKLADLSIGSIIDALAALEIDASHLSKLEDQVQAFIARGDQSDSDLKTRLGAFMKIHGLDSGIGTDLAGDVTTISGRNFIIQQTEAAVASKDHQQKLDLLRSIISDISCLDQLDKLLAVRCVIKAVVKDKVQRREAGEFTLAAAYTIIAEHLPKVNDIRQFCLISETLELILKMEGGSISQYNIDCTIGNITIFCSSNAPSLPLSEAGTIYTHLCRLLQSILMHHRLNLQGHSHLAQQAMQGLLRCLFIPTMPHSSSTTASKQKFASPPSWLQSLTLTHAQHFTKLLLLIADPPLSTLSQGRTNPLVSLKDKAKGMSAQWTKYILQEYIYLQLDMNVRMETGVREALMPGWFAVLETMNEGGRDAMRGEMDSGGRAVFGGIFDEWRRVGGRRE